jgi:hypothetical protein
VYALALSGSSIYAGGSFSSVGGQSHPNVAMIEFRDLARLVAALKDLAGELSPVPARASRPTARSMAWAPERLAVAR